MSFFANSMDSELKEKSNLFSPPITKAISDAIYKVTINAIEETVKQAEYRFGKKIDKTLTPINEKLKIIIDSIQK